MSVVILLGDVRERLRSLPADHFDCVVTSPPYWGLRDYDVDGQIGLEASLGEHLSVMVDVFREVRRVLKPSGTLWLNYGDCYATSPNGRSAAETKAAGGDDRTFRDKPMSTVGAIYSSQHNIHPAGGRRGGGNAPAGGYLKPKDLCMVPNRLAIALQEDGWWVRSEIIWGKPNAMPDSSGRFRPATAHEKFFLLTKSDEAEFWTARDTGEISASPNLAEQCLMPTSGKLGNRWIGLGHFYNAEAVRVDRSTTDDGKMPDGWNTAAGGHGSFHPQGREKGRRADKQRGHSRRHAGFNERWDEMPKAEQQSRGRLLRNYEPAPIAVWEVATRSFTEAHFATFCPELVERCLDGGCPRGGRVLDPFGGSGTTALVADGLGLDCTLIELNPAYAEMARRRIAGQQGMFADIAIIGATREAAE